MPTATGVGAVCGGEGLGVQVQLERRRKRLRGRHWEESETSMGTGGSAKCAGGGRMSSNKACGLQAVAAGMQAWQRATRR